MNPLQRLRVWLVRHYYRYLNNHGWKGQVPDHPFRDLFATTPFGPVALRLYPQAAGADKPHIVFMHGGGFVLGGLDTHHAFCLSLCQRSGHSVVAIDYRLAPEHPFPAAHDDCLHATQWIADNADQLGPSNGKLVLAGDSAGGNLATATAAQLEAPARDRLLGQIVLYPTVDYDAPRYASYTEKARGHGLTSALMHWFWGSYMHGSEFDHDSQEYRNRAMALYSDSAHRLPSTLLITAEHDPLRDEGKAYAEKLRACGVTLRYRHFPDAKHGFACSEGPHEDFLALIDEINNWLASLD